MYLVKKVLVSKSSVFYSQFKEWWKIQSPNGDFLHAAYLSKSEANKYCEKINLTMANPGV
jgi:hypothetical protein